MFFEVLVKFRNEGPVRRDTLFIYLSSSIDVIKQEFAASDSYCWDATLTFLRTFGGAVGTQVTSALITYPCQPKREFLRPIAI